MPRATTVDLVEAARGAGRATAAFDVITLEHAEAIAAAAERTGRPAVLQISHNAVRFHGARYARERRACRRMRRPPRPSCPGWPGCRLVSNRRSSCCSVPSCSAGR